MPQEILKIVVTGDLHAHLSLDEMGRRPGLARIAAYVNGLRQKGEVALFDLGDLFSGSPFGAVDGGRAVAGLVSRLGYRGLVPGNHDFDFSPEENDPLYYFNRLLPLAQGQGPKTRALALNLNYKGQPWPGADSPLVLRQSPKVAVVGVMTPLTHRPSLGPILNDFDFGLKKTLAETQDELLARLAAVAAPFSRPGDQLVALSHLGASTRAYAGLKGQISLDFPNAPTGPDLTKVPNVALVVDGHSHSVVWPSRPFGQALYANIGQGGEALAEIAVYQDAPLSLRLVAFEELLATPPDPTLEELVGQLESRLGLGEELLTLPAGSGYGLEGLWEAVVPFGQLVVEAMALKAKSQIAFLNKGSLRAGLAGRVTVGSVLTALPFNDRLLRATLPGQTLLDLLTRFGRKGFTGFPLYHGLSLYAYPAGEAVRLAGARLYDGQELLPQREYALAISGQMARLLTDSLPLKVEPAGGLQDALIDLIRARAQAAEPLGPAQAQPYRFFPDQASAERAFVERLAD